MVSSRYLPQTLLTWRARYILVIAPPLLCPYNFIVKFADAPWSHECKKLLPVWDKLGEQYESHKDIMIAKIDVTANDILAVALDRYPFFTLFPAGSQHQVRTSGGGSASRGLCLHRCHREKGVLSLGKIWSFLPSSGFWVGIAAKNLN